MLVIFPLPFWIRFCKLLYSVDVVLLADKAKRDLLFFTGKRVLSDAWVLDTAQKPYVWQRLNPEGDRPSARM